MNRRGVAMLITLMTMTVLLAGVAIVAKVRVTDQLIEMRTGERLISMDIMGAAEHPIRSWLQEEAGSAVIEPDQPSSMISILDDALFIDAKPVRVRISAWDQSGMIPLNAEQLGLSIDIEEIVWHGQSNPGLDQAAQQASVFPSPERSDAVGGLVATHNPWPTRSGTTRSRANALININTAPSELVEECFELFNLGDPSAIFESRANGEMAFYTTDVQDARQNQIRLVSISRVWSFRVDVWVGSTLRSSWSTYSNQGGNWRMVQRIGINHE